MVKTMRGKQINITNFWAKNLLGCWLLTEGMGKTIFDSSKNNYKGTLNFVNVSNAWVHGIGGWALSFAGGADNVELQDLAQVDNATALTVIMRVWHTNLDVDHCLVAKHQGGVNGFFFVRDDVANSSGRTDTYTIEIFESTGIGKIALEGATNASKLQTWQDVAFTFKENSTNGLHLYVDGVEDANSPINTNGIIGINSAVQQLKIGSKSNDTDFFNGKISYLLVYDKDLPLETIKKIQANINVLFEA